MPPAPAPAPKAPPTDTTEANLQASENRPPSAKPSGIDALRTAFEALDGELSPLKQAVLTQRANDLLIEVPGGRALALAKEQADNARLLSLIAQHLDPVPPVVMQAIRGTGTREETQQTDANDLLRDPAVRRIVTGLRANIVEIEDLTEPPDAGPT